MKNLIFSAKRQHPETSSAGLMPSPSTHAEVAAADIRLKRVKREGLGLISVLFVFGLVCRCNPSASMTGKLHEGSISAAWCAMRIHRSTSRYCFVRVYLSYDQFFTTAGLARGLDAYEAIDFNNDSHSTYSLYNPKHKKFTFINHNHG